MKIQEILRGGASLDEVREKYGIRVHVHPTLPLVGLDYHQIDSPKTDPVVMECRGLVLERGSWDLVALPFQRFFNLGDALNITARFDWSRFSCTEKHDGSLIILFNYGGEWLVKTRGSFADGRVPFPPLDRPDMTFADLFWLVVNRGSAVSLNPTCLNPNWTYCCEVCSLHNKVVRRYPTPTAYLLAIFDRTTGGEIVDEMTLLSEATTLGIPVVESSPVASHDDVDRLLKARENNNFEGFVLRDSTGLRLKVKTKTYQAMHQMLNNGALLTPRGVAPFVAREDRAGLMEVFPEALPVYDQVRSVLCREFDALLALWRANWQMENQKDFALAIVGKTKFTGILFAYRKRGASQTKEGLRAAWVASTEKIVESLFYE